MLSDIHYLERGSEKMTNEILAAIRTLEEVDTSNVTDAKAIGAAIVHLQYYADLIQYQELVSIESTGETSH